MRTGLLLIFGLNFVGCAAMTQQDVDALAGAVRQAGNVQWAAQPTPMTKTRCVTTYVAGYAYTTCKEE